MTDKDDDLAPELLVLRRTPEAYGRIAAKVDAAMALAARPCRRGRCDDEGRCGRHARDPEVAARWLRMRASQQGG